MITPLNVALQYIELSNRSDFAGMETLFTENTTYSSQATGIYLGSVDILGMQRAFHAKFSSLHWTVNVIDEIEPGIILVDYDFSGIQLNGKIIKSSGLEYVIARDSKIQHIEIQNKA